MNEHLHRAEKLAGYAQLDPENIDLLRDLAECYHLDGDQERALATLDRLMALVRRDPRGGARWNAKSNALLALGRLAGGR